MSLIFTHVINSEMFSLKCSSHTFRSSNKIQYDLVEDYKRIQIFFLLNGNKTLKRYKNCLSAKNSSLYKTDWSKWFIFVVRVGYTQLQNAMQSLMIFYSISNVDHLVTENLFVCYIFYLYFSGVNFLCLFYFEMFGLN